MKNIERLANHIAKNGPDGMLVHTIPGTSNWIICQKIEEDKWMLTLADPMGNVTFNLGTVSNKDHLDLWVEITRMGIENKASQIGQVKEIKRNILNFKRRKQYQYKKLTKLKDNQPKKH